MPIFHVVLQRSGPEWASGRALEEQSGWEEHAAFMDGLVDQGFVVLGGPLGDERRVVHAVAAASEEAIRARLAEDPWNDTHLVIDAIEPWTIRLDARTRAQFQPELWVSDAPGAIAFYERALGAIVEHHVGGGGEVVAQLRIAGARFWVSTASEDLRRFAPDAVGGTTGRTLLVVEDPASMFERAVAAGATPTSAVQPEHGWLLGRFDDPFGHQWEIGRPHPH